MGIRTFINKIKFQTSDIGFKLFLIGIFFLPSAPAISILFLIFPIFFSLKKLFRNSLNDKLNILLLTASILMIAKSIITSTFNLNSLQEWDPILNWVGLGNWIPLFMLYLGVQKYVQNSNQRELISKTLILGTIPVLFSCFSQYFFKWYGPFELFNGLIIWYQRSRTEEYQPITGLFNNPNVTGAWLAIIWPLLLTYLMKKTNNKFKFLIVFNVCVSFIISISLINSRGAWLGVVSSLPIIFGREVLIYLIPLIIIFTITIFACSLPILSNVIRDISCFVIPGNILSNFNNFSISYENIPRLMIWLKSINLIISKPLFGWGAASFPEIYFSQFGEWKGHPHNLFLELSVSYGLITSILIFSFIAILVYKTYRNIFANKGNKNNYDRAWLCSVLVFLIVHSFDIVYFDLRISIIFWILLAGLKEISNPAKKLII